MKAKEDQKLPDKVPRQVGEQTPHKRNFPCRALVAAKALPCETFALCHRIPHPRIG